MKTVLQFSKPQVKKLLSKLEGGQEVILVGDEGVYLMSFHDKEHPRTIVYAKGCDPNKDDDWYENKRRLFGGDDGGDEVGTVKQLEGLLAGPAKCLYAELSPDSISMKG